MSLASLISGTAYNLINTATGTYLDLSGADNKTVQGYQNNGGYANQRWIAIQQGDGYVFKNGRTGAYLSLQNYCSGSSSRVVVSSYPVVWKVTPAGAAGSFVVTLPLTTADLALDLFGSNPANGTSVIVYNRHNLPNQIWKFVVSTSLLP